MLKRRFINSREGKKYSEEKKNEDEKEKIYIHQDTKTLDFDDKLVLDILRKYRKEGYHTYVLPQPFNLPFGNRREDILIMKPN